MPTINKSNYMQHHITLFRSSAAACLLVLAASCSKQTPPPAEAEVDVSNATGVFSGPLPTRAQIDPEEVMLVVNGRNILRKDLAKEVNMLIMQTRMPPERVNQERERLLRQAQENIINRLLLLSAAEAENITITDEELDARVRDITSNLREGMSLEKELEKAQMTLEDFRKNLKGDLTVTKVLEAHSSDVPAASDEDVAAFYEANKDKFAQPESTECYLILRRFEPSISDEKRTEITEEMEALRKRLLEPEADFEQNAKIHSDQKGPNGEVLITIPRGKLPKPMEDLIFSMEVGTISEVVVTEAGAHLFKAVKKNEAGIPELDLVREQVRQGMTGSRKQQALAAYLQELQSKAKIEQAAP